MQETKFITRPEDVTQKTWDKFLEYHRKNPKIWELFERFSLEVINAGIKHSSSVTILGRIRYECMFEYKGEYKVNHNYAPIYSRIFIRKYPQHNDFFYFKELSDTDFNTKENE